MFDYAAFIEELRMLFARGKALRTDERNLDSEIFRRWRHETRDLIDRINRLRYDIKCSIETRAFQVLSYSSVSAKGQQQAFDRDFEDTLSELDLVVARFDKYGDPKNKPVVPALSRAAAVQASRKARCPQCDREQKCDVRGEFGRGWQSDEEAPSSYLQLHADH